MEKAFESYKKMFRYYFVFDGRTSRMQFWGAVMVNIIIGFLLMLLSFIMPFFCMAEYLYGLAVVIPLTTLTVRRLHDTGRSGWWVLTGAVPILNFVLVAFCCFAEGSLGKNRYGAMPLDD